MRAHRASRGSQSAAQGVAASGVVRPLCSLRGALSGWVAAVSLLLPMQTLAAADEAPPSRAALRGEAAEPELMTIAAASESSAFVHGAHAQSSPYLFDRVHFTSASAGAAAWSSLLPVVTVERTHLLPAAGSWPGSTGTDAFGRQFTEMGSVTYRWWLNRGGRSNLGVGVGTLGFLVAPIDGSSTGPHTLAHATPTVTVGWRYRVSDQSTIYADASGARRISADARTDLYNTKIGLEWTAKKPSALGLEKGALGMQLDSGVRMSLRVRRGGVGVYMRSQF